MAAAAVQPQDEASSINRTGIRIEIETVSNMAGPDMYDSSDYSDAESDSGWSEPEVVSAAASQSQQQSPKVPLTPDTPAWPPAWPPKMATKPTTAAESIKPHPIMMAKYCSDSGRISATSPCRFKFVFPLRLPPLIDPTMPAPPYYPPNLVSNHMEKAKRALRPVIASALLSLLGPDAPVDSSVIPPVDDSSSSSSNNSRRDVPAFPGTWLHDTTLCRLVDDPRNFDLATGRWTDQCGHRGEGIDAYQDFGDEGIAVFYAYEFRVDWRVDRDKDVDPPVVFFVAEPELRHGRVVLTAEECDDYERDYVNSMIRDREERL